MGDCSKQGTARALSKGDIATQFQPLLLCRNLGLGLPDLSISQKKAEIWILLCYLLHFLKNKFIYLFLAALGLCCCARAFSSCGAWALGARASVVVAHGL